MPNDVERYHYCRSLERAMQNLFGTQNPDWGFDSAATFQDPKNVGKALAQAAVRIKKCIAATVGNDDRLLQTTRIALDRLEEEAKKLEGDSKNELEIISALLQIVIYLLGFDWNLGKSNRTLIYHQTAEQMETDDKHLHSAEYRAGNIYDQEEKRRREIVCTLFAEEKRPLQIARIMKLPVERVKSILAQENLITRNTQSKSESSNSSPPLKGAFDADD